MERGNPNVTVYTFEAGPGGGLQYPDAELWTLDYDEARRYAQQRNYQLIANEYTFEDSELLEDYSPETRCQTCGELIDLEDAGIWAISGAEQSPADQRRYCDEAPDRLHHPAA